jgi:hypothetical protein
MMEDGEGGKGGNGTSREGEAYQSLRCQPEKDIRRERTLSAHQSM